MSYRPPDHFRYVERAARSLDLRFEDLDDGGGYLFRVSNGRRSLTMGAGRLCPYPINSAAAVSISKDKVFTNRLLSERGIPNLGGRAFFLVDEHSKLRKKGFEVADAEVYLTEIGFPCFAKPLAGSRGDFAEVIASVEDFRSYVARVATKHDSIVIQKLFAGDEYRVFVLDGEVKFCLKKAELTLVGDGKKSCGMLIDEINASLKGTGVSGIPEGGVFTNGGRPIDRASVPPPGARVPILGRRNLSAHASVGSLVEPVPPALARIARQAAAALSLRVAGVDIFSDAKVGDDAALYVIELNGNPGLHSLESLGRLDLLDDIWRSVLSTALREAEALAFLGEFC